MYIKIHKVDCKRLRVGRWKGTGLPTVREIIFWGSDRAVIATFHFQNECCTACLFSDVKIEFILILVQFFPSSRLSLLHPSIISDVAAQLWCVLANAYRLFIIQLSNHAVDYNHVHVLSCVPQQSNMKMNGKCCSIWGIAICLLAVSLATHCITQPRRYVFLVSYGQTPYPDRVCQAMWDYS